MGTITVEKTEEYTVIRYVSETPFEFRKHEYTRRVGGQSYIRRRETALELIDNTPNPYREWLTTEERVQSWEEEVPCTHPETVWSSPGMMACTNCGDELEIDCNDSDTGRHEPYLAGPRTNEWLCRHCFAPVPAPVT